MKPHEISISRRQSVKVGYVEHQGCFSWFSLNCRQLSATYHHHESNLNLCLRIQHFYSYKTLTWSKVHLWYESYAVTVHSWLLLRNLRLWIYMLRFIFNRTLFFGKPLYNSEQNVGVMTFHKQWRSCNSEVRNN